MKIPGHLMIGESLYKIAVTDIIDPKFAGGCHDDQKVILISSKQSKHEALATLFHEILHAIESEYGVELGHPKINKLEYALVQIFEQLEPKTRKKRTSGVR